MFWKRKAVKVVGDAIEARQKDQIYDDLNFLIDRVRSLEEKEEELRRRSRGTAKAVIALENRVEEFEEYMGVKYHYPDGKPYYVTKDPD